MNLLWVNNVQKCPVNDTNPLTSSCTKRYHVWTLSSESVDGARWDGKDYSGLKKNEKLEAIWPKTSILMCMDVGTTGLLRGDI